MSDKVTGRAKGGKAAAAKMTKEQLRERASNAALARWENREEGADKKSRNSSGLVSVFPSKGAALKQGTLLGITKQIEIDGIGMGVLSDGTPFLTGRGLARLCGVSHRQIQSISNEWFEDVQTPRITKIKEIILSHNLHVGDPYVAVETRSGIFFAYPDTSCLAILEYFAFDAAHIKEQAKKNYRLLAGKALRDFIYTQVGYDPRHQVPDKWIAFHDRVSLTYNHVPKGYFGIFKELADMIVTLGQAGLHLSDNFVPDISVGLQWSNHWKTKDYDLVYGERIKYEHNYPDYFPQSGSNPQEPWCYPETSLGEFRRWLRDDYIGRGKFKNYLESKVKQNHLPVSFAQIAIAAYEGES